MVGYPKTDPGSNRSNCGMSLGHRVYIVQGDNIVRMSQKAFDRLYFRGEAILPQFANRTLDIALVFYKLENRRPLEVVRIDLSRHKVRGDGSLDPEHEQEAGQLYVRRLDGVFGSKTSSPAVGVVDAEARFAERRLEAKHAPKLRGPVLRKILADLFPNRR